MRDQDAIATSVVLLVKTALAPVLERLAAAEARLAVLGDVRDRITTLETRSAGPSVTDMGLVDVRERLTAVERRVMDDALAKELGSLRERVAVVEVRAPVPGPAGQDGTDGVDGIGWDDLSVEHDGERAFTVKLLRGERVKDAGSFTIPALIYRGVYTEGKTYVPGDAVTWGGHMYHCNKATTVKPDFVAPRNEHNETMGQQGKDFWTLMVRKGDVGKPGPPGTDLRPTPVVSVGGPR